MKCKKANTPMMMITLTIIFAMVVIGVVFTLIDTQTATTTITADQFTASNTTCVELTTNCISSLISVTNATSSATTKDATGNYTICTISGQDRGLLINSDDSQDNIDNNGYTANATYTERSCQYIGGFTQTLINYLPILLAIVILAFVGGFAMKGKP